MCAPSYDIWCRDLDTDQTRTEQTCGRTDQNGKTYAQHHKSYKDRKTNIWGRERTSHNLHCKKTEMVLGRAYQPPQRRPMDLTCHHLDDKKIRQGRPAKRWRDDLDKYWIDTIWQRTAQERVIGDGMQRPSPNHGTQRLPNDDDDDMQLEAA